MITRIIGVVLTPSERSEVLQLSSLYHGRKLRQQ